MRYIKYFTLRKLDISIKNRDILLEVITDPDIKFTYQNLFFRQICEKLCCLEKTQPVDCLPPSPSIFSVLQQHKWHKTKIRTPVEIAKKLSLLMQGESYRFLLVVMITNE